MRSSGQRPDDYRRFANSQSVDHLGAYVASHELRSSPKYRVWRAVLPASRSAAAGSLEPIIGTTRSLSPWNIQIGTSRSNRARATNCAPFSGGESHSDDDRSRTISRGMLPNDCVCCTQLLDRTPRHRLGEYELVIPIGKEVLDRSFVREAALRVERPCG